MIVAGSGNDFVSGGSGNDVIEGGDGDDALDGGSGNDRIRGGAGNDNLDGNSGDDIVIGGAGNDIILGAAGADLLIGGAGMDQLNGNAGNDLLVSESTVFDNNDIALLALLAEWTSPRNYSARVNNLRGIGTGTRQNGSFFLNATTVIPDDDIDPLVGAAGTDWFVMRQQDNATDKTTDESIN